MGFEVLPLDSMSELELGSIAFTEQTPDGTITYCKNIDSTTIAYPDGTVRTEHDSGSYETHHPDGSKEVYDANLDVAVTLTAETIDQEPFL